MFTIVNHRISDRTSKIIPLPDNVFITTKRPGGIDISGRKKAKQDLNNGM